MPEVIALHSFKHAGMSRAKGAEWSEPADEAEALRKAGLVRIKQGSKVATKKPIAKAAVKRAPKKAAEPQPGHLTA